MSADRLGVEPLITADGRDYLKIGADTFDDFLDGCFRYSGSIAADLKAERVYTDPDWNGPKPNMPIKAENAGILYDDHRHRIKPGHKFRILDMDDPAMWQNCLLYTSDAADE